MRIVIATVQVPFIRGGAEVHAKSLRTALRAAGHEAEIVQIPFKWYPPERILDHMLACRLLDLTDMSGAPIDLLIGLKFPAYLIHHPNKVLWILHQHRQAYELWNDPIGRDMILYPNGAEVRDAIMEADTKFIAEAKMVYTNSKNVSKRLMQFCGLNSSPLYHPPPCADRFVSGPFEDYFFFPSRLTTIKRQHLIVEALAKTRNPVRVVFAGLPDTLPYLNHLQSMTTQLGLQNRVEWLGGITDDRKIQLYANCLGVIYPPFDEDYGYVTLEAMLSSKPVITCTDSGGTNEFVNAETGFSAEPDPVSLAQALDTLWEDHQLAKKMGSRASERYRAMNLNWTSVIHKLLR